MSAAMEPLAPDAVDPARHTIGGKAAGLLRMYRLGIPTPPWCVLTAAYVAQRPWQQDDAPFRTVYDELAQPPFMGVAVRSSAVVEDRVGASFAGVFETRFVHQPDHLAAALDAVADAAHAERTRAHGAHAPALAIVLQAAVQAEVAGVLFSADPARARPYTAYAELVAGMGGGLVGGEHTPSRVWLRVPSGAITRFEEGVDGPGTLNGETGAQLVNFLLVLEEDARDAQDVEFVIVGDKLWLLQARPLTALQADPALRPDACATSWFFDQRLNEPIRPITRTTLLPLIIQAALAEAVAMRGRTMPDDALYFYGGQAYVAHAAYRRMLSGAPRWLLTNDLRPLFPGDCHCPDDTPSRDRLHYFRTAGAALLRHAPDALLNLPRWTRFRRQTERRIEQMVRPAPEAPEAWETAWHTLDDLTFAFLRLHRWSLLWADYGYRIFRFLLGLMPKGMARYCERRLHGEMQVVTAEANRALAKYLAGELDTDTLARDYGCRSASLDYAAPTWAELAGEGRLRAVYGDVQPPPEKPPRRRGPLSLLLWPLRRALEMREEQRFLWEKILARQRYMLLDAGEHLAEDGVSPDDVFFLTWEELIAALRGESGINPADIARRKHAHHVDALIPKPAFIGPKETVPPDDNAQVLYGVGASAGRATGTAVLLTGPPSTEGLPDDAIGVLPAIDPSWSVVLPHLRGLVLERGGLLSHAAILAREYGVPLVIAVDTATRRIPDGARLTIDGDAGTVELAPTT
ncbi:MAG: PEP/pyruvate-binding domain-containing protein [Candidatus Hydrogenedentota bacterium]